MAQTPEWKLRLDTILDSARSRVGGEQQSKQASAPTSEVSRESDSLLKTASQVREALQLASGDTPGLPLTQLLAKQGEAGAGKAVGDGPTTTTGQQAEPPRSGSASVSHSPGPGAKRPQESEAPEGQMPEFPLRQQPKANPSHSGTGGKTASTLHDLVMRGREAEKAAAQAGQGPAESGALEGGRIAPKKNEGTLTRFLESNEAVVAATKRDVKAPTRPRLREVLEHVDDSANAAAARAAFPNAVAKGNLKIAEMSDFEAARALQLASVKEAKSYSDYDDDAKKRIRNAAIGGGIGGAAAGDLGAPIGAALGSEKGRRLKNAIWSGGGAAAGGLAGALGGMATGSPHAMMAGGLLGRTLGGAGGAAVGQMRHEDRRAAPKDKTTTASLLDEARTAQRGLFASAA